MVACRSVEGRLGFGGVPLVLPSVKRALRTVPLEQSDP